MSVAQLYPPRRPIAVGNHQFHSASRGCAPLRIVPQRFSTFPSLVGSFASRLVVGNCHRARRHFATLRLAPQHHAIHIISTNSVTQPHGPTRTIGVGNYRLGAPHLRVSHGTIPQHIFAQLNEYQTQWRPHSCGHRWACPAVSPLDDPRRTLSQRVASLRISTNTAFQRRRPSGGVRWEAASSAAQVYESLRSTSHDCASQRIPAKRRPHSGGVRFAGTTMYPGASRRGATRHSVAHRASTQRFIRTTSARAHAFIDAVTGIIASRKVTLGFATPRSAPHLNGRPSGRHP